MTQYSHLSFLVTSDIHGPFTFLGRIYFPWALLALFLALHSHGLLLTPLGFLSLITLSFILGAHGLSINPLLSLFSLLSLLRALLWPILTFLHHILLMGLLLLSFRAPLGLSTSSRPICLFHGPIIHYSYHLSLMVFLSTYQLFSAHVTVLLLSFGLLKLIINTHWPIRV